MVADDSDTNPKNNPKFILAPWCFFAILFAATLAIWGATVWALKAE
jgi:hypothetical protein